MLLRRFIVLPFVVSILFAFNAANCVAASDSGNTVVLISVDGLAAYYFDDPKAEMPNIRAIAAAGARAKSMKAVAPTVTWPNHTTLVTGVTPAVHGVVGNNFYDRAKHQQVTLIFDPVLDKEEIVKVPTIYDLARSNGLSTAAINWPASRNAHTLDWTTPEVHKLELYSKYTTPAVVEACRENGYSLFDEMFPGGSRNQESKTDAIGARTLNVLLAKFHPRLALIHLGNVDHVEHDKGPKSAEAYAAIKDADKEVGDIWKELQRDFAGNATIFVVSDHGFSPIKSIIFPNVVLNKAGLVSVKGKKVTGGAVRFVSQAGAGMVYVLDSKNRKAVMKDVEKAFRNLKGISKIVPTEHLRDYGVGNPKDDPNAPDMMLFAEEGYTFGDTAGGDVPFNEKPERLGSHGHDPSLPDLHATFVACGKGIKPGTVLGEIQNVSVAPTIAKLLNIKMTGKTGRPLNEILKN
jgi:predicted AlkP superfamily pyrophosphatase or phosphodiesterase